MTKRSVSCNLLWRSVATTEANAIKTTVATSIDSSVKPHGVRLRTRPKMTAAAMRGHQVIWHLAANSDIPGGNKNTDLDLKNGTAVTRNVLEAMRRNKIDKILFSSSSTVYGDVPLEALAETHGPLLPISLYGVLSLLRHFCFVERISRRDLLSPEIEGR